MFQLIKMELHPVKMNCYTLSFSDPSLPHWSMFGATRVTKLLSTTEKMLVSSRDFSTTKWYGIKLYMLLFSTEYTAL